MPPLYGLDVTDLDKWDENVTQPAVEIVESFINGSDCKHKPLPMQQTSSNPNSEDDTYFCETCERTFVGNFQWLDHLGSRRHKKMKERKSKQEKSAGVVNEITNVV